MTWPWKWQVFKNDRHLKFNNHVYLITSSAILSWSIRYFQTCSFLSHTNRSIKGVSVLLSLPTSTTLTCSLSVQNVFSSLLHYFSFINTSVSKLFHYKTNTLLVLSFLCSLSLHCQPHHLCLSSLFCLPLFHLLFAATLLPVIVCLSRVLLGTR